MFFFIKRLGQLNILPACVRNCLCHLRFFLKPFSTLFSFFSEKSLIFIIALLLVFSYRQGYNFFCLFFSLLCPQLYFFSLIPLKLKFLISSRQQKAVLPPPGNLAVRHASISKIPFSSSGFCNNVSKNNEEEGMIFYNKAKKNKVIIFCCQ